VTLTSGSVSLLGYPKVLPCTKSHFGIVRFLSYAAHKQTDNKSDKTDRQTDTLDNSTHADQHSRRGRSINQINQPRKYLKCAQSRLVTSLVYCTRSETKRKTTNSRKNSSCCKQCKNANHQIYIKIYGYIIQYTIIICSVYSRINQHKLIQL